MTSKVQLSDELREYFRDERTCNAVNFVLDSQESTWMDISRNEHIEKRYDEFQNYAEAWLYARKLQKDYFNFNASLWQNSWAKMLTKNDLRGKLEVENFCSLETTWEGAGWWYHYKIKGAKNKIKDAKKYASLYLYLSFKEKNRHNNNHDTVLLACEISEKEDERSYCPRILQEIKKSKDSIQPWTLNTNDNDYELKNEGCFEHKLVLKDGIETFNYDDCKMDILADVIKKAIDMA